jgi:hypothetical protein
MDYPYLAFEAHMPHWPHPALFVTTRATMNSTRTAIQQELQFNKKREKLS